MRNILFFVSFLSLYLIFLFNFSHSKVQLKFRGSSSMWYGCGSRCSHWAQSWLFGMVLQKNWATRRLVPVMDSSLSFNANYPIVEQQLRQQQHQQLTCTHCVNVSERERKRSTLIFCPLFYFMIMVALHLHSIPFLLADWLAGWLVGFFPFTSKWKDVVKRQWRQSAAMNEQSVEHHVSRAVQTLCIFQLCIEIYGEEDN